LNSESVTYIFYYLEFYQGDSDLRQWRDSLEIVC
jgi:hypothetical protein